MALSRKRRFTAMAIGLIFILGSAAVVISVYKGGTSAILPGIIALGLGVGGVARAMERIRARDRIAHSAGNTAQAAEKTDTTTTRVRCPNCQHVQATPRSQPTFVCEQCKAHLTRRTAPNNGS
jgi:uncharacterized paraquat-inducible protein A